MELADTIRFKSAQLLTFALSKACNSELYCLASQTKAYISELNYSHYSGERFCMEQSSLGDISTFKPSLGIARDAPSIFNRATKTEKHRLLIDAHLLSQEMKVSDERIALAQIHWSPAVPDLHGYYYLAYLTNFGGCEIRAKVVGKRMWDHVQHDISTKWLLECQRSMKHVLNSFEEFEIAVNKIKITAISWHIMRNGSRRQSEQPMLCLITASGCFVVFEIGPELTICFQKQLSHRLVQSMQWFSYLDKFKQHQSFVIACELSGKIGLFSIRFDEQCKTVADIDGILWLFDEPDGVFANGVQWEYMGDNDRMLVVFCKGMHLFVAVIGLEESHIRLISTSNEYIGHMNINAIARMNPMEYVVGTMTGHLEKVYFDIDPKGDIRIKKNVMKSPNGSSKYGIHGLVASQNGAFLLIAYYARRPFDHLVLREPAHIVIGHYIDGRKAVQTLLQSANGNLSTQHDLAALIQNIRIRNDTVLQSYLNAYPSEMDCTDAYTHNIKVRLIVTSARCTFLKLKNRLIESSSVFAEYGFLQRMILAIRSYRILEHLGGKRRTYSDFQLLAVICNRMILRNFISLSICDEYDVIKLPFHKAIEEILAKTNDSTLQMVENCAYCNKPIEQSTQTCSDKHDMQRCCISSIQLPLMQHRQCIKCQQFALDDRDKLNEILPKDLHIIDDIVCPMCDSVMETPQATYSTSME